MIDRLALERREFEVLGPNAAKSAESRGRMRPEPEDELRTAFQRDRDRILHCKSFRRLSHKTQVFIGAQGDHYRTRLTHTLEVQQISRTIARALRLNEDLTEAIALGHDLGHTPFGHTGETALRDVIAEYNCSHPENLHHTFNHNEQSLRVVDLIEKNGKGLNLTEEVRDGILNHTGSGKAHTLEGQIVATADRIAYVNHDIDDSIRAGIIRESDLPKSCTKVVGNSHSQRITSMVHAMVSASDGRDEISMEPDVYDAMNELRSFLFENVYTKSAAKEEGPKAEVMIKLLFEYYLSHMDEVPSEYADISKGDDVVAVVDYIAGMTDRYAISKFEELFIPRNWRG
ncbi:MAG: deoxyguanosinetriphosphate triphosphohydrolase [Coriobacteriales bacterium]|jgi:dGTPase